MDRITSISIIQTTVHEYRNKSIQRIVMDFLTFSFAYRFEIGMNL